MANHCNNHYTFTKSTMDNTKKILDFFEDYENHDCVTDWYNKHFGTSHDRKEYSEIVGARWLEFTLEPSYKEDTIQIFGDSAWSPTIPLMKKLAEHYELDLDGEYEESGNDIAGEITITDGEITEFDCGYMTFRYRHGGVNSVLDELEHRPCDTMEEYLDDLAEVEGLSKNDRQEIISEIKSWV